LTTTTTQTIQRPTARFTRLLLKEEAVKAEPGSDDYGHRGYIEFYGLDGLAIIELTDMPPCVRQNDEVWNDSTESYDKVPHVHKPWCDKHTISIPFVRSPTSKRVVGIYRNKETGAEEHRDERNAWGWDGNKEKPSLTPSFLMQFTHTMSDEPGPDGKIPHVDVHFHCFIGDPYGPGTGRFGPGVMDVLESHIKTADGRQIPMVRA